MAEIIIAIAALCGPRTQGTTLVNAGGEYVNGYANAAAKSCQKALLECADSQPGNLSASDLIYCLKNDN